jgi:hypothetical protein
MVRGSVFVFFWTCPTCLKAGPPLATHALVHKKRNACTHPSSANFMRSPIFMHACTIRNMQSRMEHLYRKGRQVCGGRSKCAKAAFLNKAFSDHPTTRPSIVPHMDKPAGSAVALNLYPFPEEVLWRCSRHLWMASSSLDQIYPPLVEA